MVGFEYSSVTSGHCVSLSVNVVWIDLVWFTINHHFLYQSSFSERWVCRLVKDKYNIVLKYGTP